jgi:hypothetical protein
MTSPHTGLGLHGSAEVAWTDLPAGAADGTVIFGNDNTDSGAIQIGVTSVSARPTKALLDDLWETRAKRAPIGFVVAAVAPDGVWVYYPTTAADPAGPVAPDLAARQLQSVLDEENGLAAHGKMRAVQERLSSADGHAFSNHFLFATYYLDRDVPNRSDWSEESRKAASILSSRGSELISALGFSAEPVASDRVLVLRTADGPQRAVAVLLRDDENFDHKSAAYQLTPVAKALEVAGRREVPWVIALRKSTLRLYPGRDGVGVGQRGQSETYFELELDQLSSDQAAFLTLIFSAEALDAGGSAQQILDGSGKYAADLGIRLRDRVYEGVVPRVALAIADRLPSLGLELNADGLQMAYRLTMRILFRLLFQAYGEAAELLPAGRNTNYDNNSLQNFIKGAMNVPEDEFSTESTAAWADLAQVWGVIFHGNPLWEVPPYGGSLFDPSTEEGRFLKRLELPDSVIGPALQALLSEDTVDGTRGQVDFRSLQVREFGTIYEGLLESSLSLAEQDLTVDRNGAYLPVKDGDEIVAPEGHPYFHSASGERKATGSYYTPKVVVDHLIERSVKPALDAHLDRIKDLMEDGKERQAADAFFDFRVADLAMGSAHFLVAAVDKIERGMRDFLTATEVPGVRAELSRLAEKARDALGHDTDGAKTITDGQLLRRQIARRCIYGLDINPLAVELAQLALWIHTFVPGLPMSSLDHGLVLGNSLTGIGTIDEAVQALNVGPILEPLIREPIHAASVLLDDYSAASEADKAEVAAGAEVLVAAKIAAAPAKAIFDVAVAKRLGVNVGEAWTIEQFETLAATPQVRDAVDPLNPAHMPYLFPEVFEHDRGFDALVGNPPWEEVMVEEPKFWLRVRPGLLGLKPAALKAEISRLRCERADLLPELEQEIERVAALRKVLLSGPYPGLGTGDIDLYQAFAWRFWQLPREGGALAFIAPRSLMNAAGNGRWRSTVMPRASTQVVTLTNSSNWVFENVDGRYSFALCAIIREADDRGSVQLAGPFYNEREFLAGRDDLGTLDFAAIAASSSNAALPNLPDATSVEIFAQLRAAPRLDTKSDGWDFRPMAEFHATNDRPIFDDGSQVVGKLPVRGGAGFELWNPETAEVYAWADPTKVEAALQAKRQRQIGLKSSAFFGKPRSWADDPETLPFHHPRVAFRDIARSTDTRTTIAALMSPETVLTNKAPYVFLYKGNQRAEAYLLGVLCSIPLDWYSRKYVELGMNFHIFNGLPIPHYSPESAVAHRIAIAAGRLAAIDERYNAWADEVGVEVGTANDEPTKSELIAELDALVSLLYSLTSEQVQHIFATFHRGWDYAARLERVLHYYEQWKDAA